MLKPFSVGGNPYIGVYLCTNNNVTFVPEGYDTDTKTVSQVLDTDTVELTIGSAHVLGSMLALSNSKALVSDFITDDELGILRDYIEVELYTGTLTAVGNNILMNDRAALVNPDFTDAEVEFIGEFFGLKVMRGTIAGLKVVGSAAVVTNRGVLTHPKITKEEKKMLQEVFGFDEIAIGTCNFGVPYIGACMVANDKGALVGERSTGIEINRIEDALDLIG